MMIAGILDYLLIRSQIMILNADAIIELYDAADVEIFLESLEEVLGVDDFLLLDDEYIDKVLKISNHFRLESRSPFINRICNEIIIYLNKELLRTTSNQRLALREKYVEVQRSLHKIDKYEQEFGVKFINDLLKEEYVNVSSVIEGLESGAKIYDSNGNVIRTVDIVKEKKSIDMPMLGIGEVTSDDIYWYLSSYKFTFTMSYLIDKLRDLGALNKETLEFIKALLEIAEIDKKKNKENYKDYETEIEPSLILKTNTKKLEPFVNIANGVIGSVDRCHKKYIDYKVNNYCKEKTKMLIKDIDREIKTL